MSLKLIAAGALLLPISTSLIASDVQSEATAVVKPTSQAPQPVISAPVRQNAVLRAGTPVKLAFRETITTKKKAAKVNQRVNMEVAEAIEVNGVTVVPAGTPAWAELTSVKNKGMWGKSGKLEGTVRYMRVNGRQIRLSGSFDDKGVTGTAGVVGAVALLPVVGFFTTGTSAELPQGGIITGYVDEDVELAFEAREPSPMVVSVPQTDE